MPDDQPINRRRFFRAGLRELFKPLVNGMDPFEQVMRKIGDLEEPLPPRPVPAPQPAPVPATQGPFNTRPRNARGGAWLRPPGALDEDQFAQACTRCGDCVKVCPANAIRVDADGIGGDGLPYIVPNLMACVACDGLYCMSACPTGALVPTPLVQIDMGTAQWRENLCLRSSGESCTLCIDQCPIGAMAIELKDGKVRVHEAGCIGCGVCQHECPTTPKSIVVIPKSAR